MPARRDNPNKVKRHFSYTAGELAHLFGVHKNTIRNWEREGLVPLDNKRPKIFAGSEVRAFLIRRQAARENPCPIGTFYCLRCRKPTKPLSNAVEYNQLRPGSGNLTAACEDCEGVLHQRIREADIVRKFPNCACQLSHAQPSLTEKGNPSLNCENGREG